MVESKSFTFAVQITHLSRKLANDQKEFILANQLLRAGTAIGALVSEAKFAQSKADFINKMNVALKEANESSYWLRLLNATSIIETDTFNSTHRKAEELVRLLASIVKTSKENLAEELKKSDAS